MLLVTHEYQQTSIPLDLSEQSEGFRRFLAHLIAMYQSPSKQVLIFEEPEKGIYPGAIQVLADQFKACAASGRGQIILTTHSPELLNHFDPALIRAFTVSDLETKVGLLADDQVASIRDQLMTTGEILTIDAPRIQNGEPTT